MVDEFVAKSVADLLGEIRDILKVAPVVPGAVIPRPIGDVSVKDKHATNTTSFKSIVILEVGTQLAKIVVSGATAHEIQLIIDTDPDKTYTYFVGDDFTLIDWFPFGKAFKASRSVEIKAKAKTSGTTIHGAITGE